MVTAGCYARKSTDEGDKAADAKSVARQVQRAREYAAERGWRFDDRYVISDDGVSGAEFKSRAGLNALLSAVKERHRLNALVVSEQSRLGRDTIRTLALIQALNDADVKIYSYLDDKEISVNDELGEIEQFIKSWAGASERRKTSQRVRDRLRQKAERGESTGGRLYGYATAGKQRTIKPSEAAVIRRIFKRRIDGAGYFKIAKELNREKVPSPSGATLWWGSQVGSILRNETYAGTRVWGLRRRTKRRGTTVVEKSLESVVRREAPALRIVTDAQWRAAQAVNEVATERTWRSPDGRLKSRPTESRHLLAPFLACGVCGGSMHVQYSKKREERLFCTRRHNLGAVRCSNQRGLLVKAAEHFILDKFAEVLVSKIVMSKIEAALEAHRAAQADPEPLRAEAKRLRAEIKRLVDSLASGEVEEVRDAVNQRRARLDRVEEELSGAAAIQGIDSRAVRADIAAEMEALMADWRAHLRKNTSTAQQVLRKILPQKLRVTPSKSGDKWFFEGMTDYTAALREVGFAPALSALESISKVPRTPSR